MIIVFPDGSGRFQEDNVPFNIAHIALEWFEEHAKMYMLLTWPLKVPDLNPIEHM